MYARYAKLRDDRNMTDNSVAVASGITQSTIYDWKKRSEGNPNASLSVENLSKIAKVFNVPLDYFLYENRAEN